jgi:DNA-binding MarR family transcriptional regulator
LADHFAYSFNGRLELRRGLRGIAKKTQMTVTTVRRAIKDLEATGLLVVDRRYDRRKREYVISRYRAVGYPKKLYSEEELPF